MESERGSENEKETRSTILETGQEMERAREIIARMSPPGKGIAEMEETADVICKGNTVPTGRTKGEATKGGSPGTRTLRGI
jgi:hypothetical protein